MAQVFISPADISGHTFHLRGSEAHHVLRVLRKKTGDTLLFFDGSGRRFEGRLTELSSDGLTAKGELIREFPRADEKPARILFQGLPRGAKFDFVIEKAVELGVDVIAPFLSEKNPIKLTDGTPPQRQSRWENLVKAASKQCNRADLPLMESVRSLKEYESWFRSGLTLVFDHAGDRALLRDLLRSASVETKPLNFVVGPEAGFSPEEIKWFTGLGARLISLGERTLRSETAGLSILSIAAYELGR